MHLQSRAPTSSRVGEIRARGIRPVQRSKREIGAVENVPLYRSEPDKSELSRFGAIQIRHWNPGAVKRSTRKWKNSFLLYRPPIWPPHERRFRVRRYFRCGRVSFGKREDHRARTDTHQNRRSPFWNGTGQGFPDRRCHLLDATSVPFSASKLFGTAQIWVRVAR